MAFVKALSISTEKGMAKNNIAKGKFIEDHGIEGDAHAGNWHRQVSLLSSESIEKMRNMGLNDLIPGSFGENITTEEIDFSEIAIGIILKIGNEVELEITQIGKECHSRCRIYYSVGDCIMPNEGLFAKVTKGGWVYTGDSITVITCPDLS